MHATVNANEMQYNIRPMLTRLIWPRSNFVIWYTATETHIVETLIIAALSCTVLYTFAVDLASSN